jgi:hypothetical protein
MVEPTRRSWSKPELIVIVRGRLEESVLTTRKSGSTPYTPAFAIGCGWGYFYDCHAQANS